MVQLVLAGFENDALFDAFRNTSRVAPGLFALVPTLTALYLARAQLDAPPGLEPRRCGSASPPAARSLFALLMIIPALLTGDLNAVVGQTFGYALLWGARRRAHRHACSPPRPPAPATASPPAAACSPTPR